MSDKGILTLIDEAGVSCTGDLHEFLRVYIHYLRRDVCDIEGHALRLRDLVVARCNAALRRMVIVHQESFVMGSASPLQRFLDSRPVGFGVNFPCDVAVLTGPLVFS